MSSALAILDNPGDKFPILAADGAEAMAAFMENMGEDATISLSDLTRIKMPTSGGKQWELPSVLSDEPDFARDFEAIILSKHKTRIYWAKKFEDRDTGDGATGRPDCSSNDAKIGFAPPGSPVPWADEEHGGTNACNGCPFAQWGSGKNGGQACQEREMFYLLLPGHIVPSILSVPATGGKAIRQYMLGLSSKNIPHTGVVTRFKLAQVKNKQGIEYSEVRLEAAGRLSAEDTAAVRAAAQQITSMLAQPASPVDSAARYVPEVDEDLELL